MIPKFLFILSVFANLFCKAIQPESYSKNEVSECTCGDSQPDPANTLPWTYICIIGNSQHSNNALRSHKMWGGAFPSFWFVWGKDDTPIEPVAGLHILKSNQTKTWAEGIEFLLGHARELFDCEYFFTHDDDLQFRLKNQTDARSLETVLTDLMLEYQPAVAGFPWEFGDKTYSGMKSQKAVNENTRVNVLTGFDSGYDYIPHVYMWIFSFQYSPRGEGGFFGSWSLCAHFIHSFCSRLLSKERQSASMKLQYDNLVSISNVPIKQRKNRNGKLNKDGLVIQAESRHPYEYNKNKPVCSNFWLRVC
ncbi:hypothetical protein BDR26DRAFT_334690 [Obelidium mucronatum]|nr:hypothetical protein BDR26DRAFT_334690 [Obelidium mucronatum]